MFIVRADGKDRRQVSPSYPFPSYSFDPYASPVWSANGQMLAYVVRDPSNCDELLTLKVRTSGAGEPVPAQVARVCPNPSVTAGLIMSPTWAPDGKSIDYLTFYGSSGEGTRLVRVDIATGATRTVLSEPDVRCTTVLVNAVYAPDGRSVAVTADQSCSNASESKILFVTPSGGTASKPFDLPYLPIHLDWSRDGARLLFTGSAVGQPGCSAAVMEVLSATTGAVLAQKHGSDANTDSAVFSPDGKQVLTFGSGVCGSGDGLLVGTAGLTGFHVISRPAGEVGWQPVRVARIAAVRFAAASAGQPGTPGLPVIKDDGNRPVADRDWGPAKCADGLADPRGYDYLSCALPLPAAAPVKDWPVIYTAGHLLSISKAVVIAAPGLISPEITAKAVLTTPGGKVTLTLPVVKPASTKKDGGDELTVADLEFDGRLPDTPGRDELAITWTVTAADGSTPAGTSHHTIYLTAGTYARPEDTDALPPYISLLDVGTRAAAGKASPRAVFDAI